jgi:hypothetical protein
MEFAETLMFAGVIRWYFVGKSEEEELEWLTRDEVEMGFPDTVGACFRCTRAMRGSRGLLHLLEPMYNGQMELVFVG